MPCKLDLSAMIVAEAQHQSVDPGVALSVARRETGVCHWRPDGSVVIGAAGEVGVMQIMPSSAPGVDLYDLETNIRTGVSMLRDLKSRFETWPLAVAAYNWGEGHLSRAIAAGTSIPRQVQNYVSAVLGVSAVYNAGITKGNDTRASADPTPVTVGSSGAGLALAAAAAILLTWAFVT